VRRARRKARRETAQPTDLVVRERQIPLQEVVVARGQGRDPEVRDLVFQVLVRVCGLAALELGVQR
jgi:hypothetical protein